MKLDPFARAILNAEIKTIENNVVTLSDVDNLLLNMMSGLLPEHLSEDEVAMLVERFGDDWLSELGYAEADGYAMPTFE
jgi:hypothetical protein